MKLKLNFGKGGLKGFIVQHAEKAIFGMVLVLVAVFVYSSATLESVDEGQSPSSLKGSAGGALKNLQNANAWATIGPERQRKVDNYPALAGIAGSPVDPQPYTGDPWIKELFRRQQKRQDPAMYQPEQVEAEAGVFAIMMRTRILDDTWLDSKDAIAKAKEPPKPKPKPRRRTRMPGGSSGMYGDMGDMYGSMMPGMPGADGSGSSMPSMGDEYGSMMPGAPGVGTTGIRRQLGQFYISHYLSKGYRPGGGMSMGMPGVVNAPPGVAAKSFPMVAVKALVPYEKQWEEYERALANATGYSPMHDIPKYLLFVAERAEVPDDPNAELQWQPVSNSSFAMKAAMEFAGIPPEVADETYLLPGILTMPIPPVLLQPYDSLALHSQVPKKQLATNLAMAQPATGEQGKEGSKEEAKPGAEGAPKPTTDFSEGLPQIPLAGAGAAGGYGMMPGMAPGMPGSMPGMMPGMMPYPGADAGSGSTMYAGEYGMAPGMDMAGSGSGYPGSMPGGYGMPGYGMPGTYGAPGMPAVRPVKYKMIRFFDLTAEAGKTYRYRVRVMLEDPNRPQNKAAEPNPRILDQAVADRLAKVTAEDEDVLKKTGKERRTYWLQTEWSEPSEPVTVVEPAGFAGGSATGPRFIRLPPNGPSVEYEEPKGNVAAVIWDERRATEVPAEREVLRGAFLSFQQDVDVLHPITLQIRRLEGYAFDTDAFVADLRGGEPLMVDVDKDTKEETPLPVPGEYLVVDGSGRLIACNEVDDAEEYRRVLFIEDAPTGAMTPGSSYGDTMMGSGGYMPYGAGP